jgi:arylsulfatase A-like enzyme
MTGSLKARFTLETEKAEERLCALGEVSLRQLGEAPPTVILITSDTHRADYTGYSESEVDVRTPYLDALAERGLVFDDCATSTNVTNPSHVALMTGTHPVQTGVIGNDTPLSHVAPTLAEAFRDAGYITWASVSAAHLGHDKSGLGQGFERMNTPAAFQRDSIDTIAGLKEWLPDAEGQPLFIWLHLFDVHAPYAPPDEWKNMYYPDGADPYDEALPDPVDWASPKWDRKVRDLTYFEALYRSEITYQDEQISKLLEDSRFSDALVAFTSDHGESLGAHGIFWDHRELYPNTLHVPLLLVGPNVPSEGSRNSGPVRQIDLGRTLLDLSGLYGAAFPGTNVLEENKTKEVRYSMSANGTSAAVMTDDWFFALHLKTHVVYAGSKPAPMHTAELYNLQEDPRCLTNLASEDEERAKEMRRMLIAWLTNSEQKGWTVTRNYQDLQALEQLAALGYTTIAPQRGARVWIDLNCDCEHCAKFE